MRIANVRLERKGKGWRWFLITFLLQFTFVGWKSFSCFLNFAFTLFRSYTLCKILRWQFHFDTFFLFSMNFGCYGLKRQYLRSNPKHKSVNQLEIQHQAGFTFAWSLIVIDASTMPESCWIGMKLIWFKTHWVCCSNFMLWDCVLSFGVMTFIPTA